MCLRNLFGGGSCCWLLFIIIVILLCNDCDDNCGNNALNDCGCGC